MKTCVCGELFDVRDGAACLSCENWAKVHPDRPRPKVYWIVAEGNHEDVYSNGDFGVEIDGVPHFFYKDDLPLITSEVKYRRVEKREFGEVIRPERRS